MYKKHFLPEYCIYLEKEITLLMPLHHLQQSFQFWNKTPSRSLLLGIDRKRLSTSSPCSSTFIKHVKLTYGKWDISTTKCNYKLSVWTEKKIISWHSISSSQGTNPSSNSNPTGKTYTDFPAFYWIYGLPEPTKNFMFTELLKAWNILQT